MTETDVLQAITERIEKSFDKMEETSAKQAEAITSIQAHIQNHLECSTKLEKEIKYNTRFRFRMEGLAWARYGIPAVLFLMSIGTIVLNYIKG